MHSHDTRVGLRRAVYGTAMLTDAEKVYLLGVLDLPAERHGGEVRAGSRAIDERGCYALHNDYIAARLGIGIRAVQMRRHSVERKGWLRRIHPATFGRPVTYQMVAPNRDAGRC